jgi:hypothetical protein
LIETECFDELNKFGPLNTPSNDLLDEMAENHLTNKNNLNRKHQSKLAKFLFGKNKSVSKSELNNINKSLSVINNSSTINNYNKNTNRSEGFKFFSNLFRKKTKSIPDKLNEEH